MLQSISTKGKSWLSSQTMLACHWIRVSMEEGVTAAFVSSRLGVTYTAAAAAAYSLLEDQE